jgi:hypothetical protein
MRYPHKSWRGGWTDSGLCHLGICTRREVENRALLETRSWRHQGCLWRGPRKNTVGYSQGLYPTVEQVTYLAARWRTCLAGRGRAEWEGRHTFLQWIRKFLPELLSLVDRMDMQMKVSKKNREKVTMVQKKGTTKKRGMMCFFWEGEHRQQFRREGLGEGRIKEGRQSCGLEPRLPSWCNLQCSRM